MNLICIMYIFMTWYTVYNRNVYTGFAVVMFTWIGNCVSLSFNSFSLFLIDLNSQGGGQHVDHYHSLSSRWSNCILDGLHVAQELHTFCSLQARGEKVSGFFSTVSWFELRSTISNKQIHTKKFSYTVYTVYINSLFCF